jgi:heme/copper-type cytochrome/quinol oxidase subunit 1
MVSSGMLRRVALVRTDVSEELSVFFIRLTGIGELITTLAATSNRRTLRRNTKSSQKTPVFIVTAVPTFIILFHSGTLLVADPTGSTRYPGYCR